MTAQPPEITPFFGLRPAPSATRPRDPRPGVSGLTPEELAAWMSEAGLPGYRSRQVLDAVWRGRQAAFSDVLTLPGAAATGSRRRSGSTRWPRPRSVLPTRA